MASRRSARTKKTKAADPLFPARPKSFRIGGDVRPKKDLSRFVRWPRYIRIQRQRKILLQRLKVPPALNQFRSPLDKAEAAPLFRLLAKYAPESKADKTARIEAQAEAKAAAEAAGETYTPPAPEKPVIKFGLNHVTHLVEQRRAKLVVIASDVDPIELVVWLPALCRRMGVPYVIVNNKGRLGQVVNRGKKCAAVAVTDVSKEDNAALAKICDMAKGKFNENMTVQRRWGGGIMGLKTQRKVAARKAALEAEAAKRSMY